MTAVYIALGIFSLYGCALVLLFVLQPHLTFFPRREIVATPHELGLDYEEVSFRTEDDAEISAWFVPAENPRGVILFCHGNAGNISDRLAYVDLFHRLHFSVFIFDYRGYGNSRGKTTEEGVYLDARGAWELLVEKKGIAPKEIVIFGESLGGAVAAWLAREKTPGALVISSSFTSFADVASVHYPWLPVRLLARFRFNTLDCVSQVKCPVLVVHSRDDEIAPYSQGRRLYDAAPEPKRFIEIRGDHNNAFLASAGSLSQSITDFMEKYLGK